MPTPHCPSCRESMSSVEFQTPGFWSCLYCEGTWIPGNEVGFLASKTSRAPSHDEWTVIEVAETEKTPRFVCPDCCSSEFSHVSARGFIAQACQKCHGIYLPKGLLQALVPKEGESSAPEDAASSIAVAVGGEVLASIIGSILGG